MSILWRDDMCRLWEILRELFIKGQTDDAYSERSSVSLRGDTGRSWL